MGGRVTTSIKEVLNAHVRTQQILFGSTISLEEKGSTFIITALFGSTNDIVVKDENGNTIIQSSGTAIFDIPLLIENKFTITGTNLSVVVGRLK